MRDSKKFKLKKSSYSHFLVGVFIFFFSFFSSAIISGMLTPVDDSSAQTVSVENRATGYFITVTAPDSAGLNVTPSAEDTVSVSPASNVNVLTNAPGGYKLYLSATNVDLSATNITPKFTPTESSSLSPNSWGYSLDQSTWSGITTSEVNISSREQSNYPNGTNVPVYYGVKANTTMPAATYSTTVTYTAFAEGIYQKLSDVVAVGDYVHMVPNYVGSYTPTTNSSSPYYTGTSTPGSVTPSELDTWVVIKKNANGSLEMVSKNVSSSNITFYGRSGYDNFVESLEKIAEQYENSNFTSSSRYFGHKEGEVMYNGGDSSSWRHGEGSTYYETDMNLVKNALGVRGEATLIAGNPNNVVEYWLGSSSFTNTSTLWYCEARYITTSGTTTYTTLSSHGVGGTQYALPKAIRPILTTKPDILVDTTGDGSAAHPWVLTTY